jgi:raffinose/stachyose/melibiose transport system permease protein
VRTRRHLWLGLFGIVLFAVVFLVPFAFVLFTAAKTRTEAGELQFSLPTTWTLLQNFGDALRARDYMLIIAFINSTILTVVSIAILVVLSAMVAYVVQRRQSRWNGVINFLVLSGLIIPPAVVPTVWVLQKLGLFKTLTGLIFIEVAFGLSFCILLFRAFIATIPRDLDEAAIIDGAGPARLFFKVIFPLLKSVIVTVVIVQSVAIFNDFATRCTSSPGTRTPPCS